MVKTICDRCGEDIKQDGVPQMVLFAAPGSMEDRFDLCPNCHKAALRWVSEGIERAAVIR